MMSNPISEIEFGCCEMLMDKLHVKSKHEIFKMIGTFKREVISDE